MLRPRSRVERVRGLEAKPEPVEGHREGKRTQGLDRPGSKPRAQKWAGPEARRPKGQKQEELGARGPGAQRWGLIPLQPPVQLFLICAANSVQKM